MATVSKLQLKCKLDDGKSTVISLPAPINMTLTDEDTGDTLYDKVYSAIADTFETDDGAHIVSMTFEIVKTTTTTVAEGVSA